jgi:tRNA nucleotidyltransferase (CCA-adding enzyme)
MGMTNELENKAKRINALLTRAGGQCLKVGGCVRDKFLGKGNKDIDIEVFGLSYNQIVAILKAEQLRCDVVGEAFGVIKVDNDIDVSIPRRENKAGVGHKGFNVMPDPNMTKEDAAARRDFTINSMAETFGGELVDPFDGQADIEAKVLRATSGAFVEDPLRVLRGMQFAARFGFTMDAKTVDMCRVLRHEFDTLAKERIWGEWEKWATKATDAKAGLDLLADTGWLEMFPELEAINKAEQDPEWHPEGNTWEHTTFVCNAMIDICDRDNVTGANRLVAMFAALCHDLGKATTTVFKDGHWKAPGHDQAGVTITEAFLTSISAPHWLIEKVKPLVAQHMRHCGIKDEQLNARIVRRLANDLAPATMEEWSRIVEADHSGRPPLAKGNPVEAWMKLAAELKLEDAAPKPLLMGRHLIDAGMKPGPHFGPVLKAAFEDQLDGVFNDEAGAVEWMRNNL